MKQIDIETWKRKEHFEFFKRSDLPFYNVNINIDITGIPEFAKNNGLSLNSTLIHLTIRSLNSVENFRYRLRGETVVLHDRIHPSFAHLKPGEDLFRMITVDFDDNLFEFDKIVRNEVECSNSCFNFQKMQGRDDFAFISPLPWFSFTAVDHTLSLKKDDAIPRITWGRYFLQDNKTLLPLNIQVNHIFVDGIHVGYFLNEFNDAIAGLI